MSAAIHLICANIDASIARARDIVEIDRLSPDSGASAKPWAYRAEMVIPRGIASVVEELWVCINRVLCRSFYPVATEFPAAMVSQIIQIAVMYAQHSPVLRLEEAVVLGVYHDVVCEDIEIANAGLASDNHRPAIAMAVIAGVENCIIAYRPITKVCGKGMDSISLPNLKYDVVRDNSAARGGNIDPVLLIATKRGSA